MSEPFIGEVRMWALNFAPRNWAFCDGQLLPVAQNTALFSLLGTTYGGDGRTTFALPNLKGRAPMHPGRGPGLTQRQLGQPIGVENVTLSEAQIPSHNHTLRSNNAARGGKTDPTGNTFNRSAGGNAYGPASNTKPMSSTMLQNVGGGQSHENRQPYLTINFCIALQGLYPSRG